MYNLIKKIFSKFGYKLVKESELGMVTPSPISYESQYLNKSLVHTMHFIHISFAELFDLDRKQYKNLSRDDMTLSKQEEAMFAAAHYEWWCERNINGRWFHDEYSHGYEFAFEDESDAIAFKMYAV